MPIPVSGYPKRNECDIVTYKAFRKVGPFLISPFHDKLVVWLRNITYKTKDFRFTEKDAVNALTLIPAQKSVSTGGYYSVNNWQNLEKQMITDGEEIVIRECIIPANTPYYFYAGEYCSEKLILIGKEDLKSDDGKPKSFTRRLLEILNIPPEKFILIQPQL